MRKLRALWLLLMAGAVAGLTGCPSPFGYYSAGNKVITPVVTEATSGATSVATPVFSATPAAGGATIDISPTPGGVTEDADQLVSIESSTTGATIYYTTDGSVPDPYSPTTHAFDAANPIPVSGNTTSMTISAIAFKALMQPSAIVTVTITISYTTASSPAFDHASATYSNGFTLTITDSTTNATIWYTTDGSTPIAGSSPSGASPVTLSVNSSQTVNAIATAPNFSQSSGTTATFTLAPAVPTFSPTGPVTIGGYSITISSATTGATIWYTTDGSTPIAGVGNSAPSGVSLTIYRTTTVKAVASTTTSGWSPSAVASTTITTGLVAYYPFDGNANDLSGNGWNATTSTPPPTSVAGHLGVAGTAYSFDGSSQYFDTALQHFAAANNVTVSFWVKVPAATTSVNYFIHSSDFGFAQNGMAVAFAIASSTTNNTDSAQLTLPAVNTWYHITGTYDGTTITIYLDGTAQSPTTNQLGPLYPKTDPLEIGHWASVSSFWPGTIDELRIYDRVLAPTEISSVVNYPN